MLTILAVMLLLASLAVWPQIDLAISSQFYEPGKGFLHAREDFFRFMEELAYYGARVLCLLFGLCAIVALWIRKPLKLFGAPIRAKGWLFLLLALLLGPGLIVNLGFKNHWGRARPREISEFGGPAQFSAALEPQIITRNNGSFMSGDAAFGFFLPSFAYVMPIRQDMKRRKKSDGKEKTIPLSRRFFWGGTAAGVLFGFARLAMGAHFFSDVLFAAFFVLSATAFLHMLMFGRRATVMHWRDWFFYQPKSPENKA
jgi:lipid A 4'-phosphatase